MQSDGVTKVVQTDERGCLDLPLTGKLERLMTYVKRVVKTTSILTHKTGGLTLAEIIYFGDHNPGENLPVTHIPTKFHQNTNDIHENLWAQLLKLFLQIPLHRPNKALLQTVFQNHTNRKPKPIRFVSVSDMDTKRSEKRRVYQNYDLNKDGGDCHIPRSRSEVLVVPSELGSPKVGQTESLPKLGKLGVRKESFSKGVHWQQCTPNDMVWGSLVSLQVRFINVFAS
ncbi:hypothetical protein EPI10_000486 [Gossypium australe]|uniref:Uncharacterized protein n=1 Tax=Gossypium australe TaxID=47621 RepID=A0A5B6V8E6_9ROSI|nr:hypothetical protein EPI10_000486 [Gossypium australe]